MATLTVTSDLTSGAGLSSMAVTGLLDEDCGTIALRGAHGPR